MRATRARRRIAGRAGPPNVCGFDDDQYISAFREAGLKVNRLDDTLVPPFAVYVLSR